MDFNVGAGDGRKRDGGVVLNISRHGGQSMVLKMPEWSYVFFDLLGALRQNNANHSILILNPLGLLGTLKERNIQDESSTSRSAQEVLCIGIPANGERVLPAAEDGVTRLGDQQGLFLAAPERGG